MIEQYSPLMLLCTHLLYWWWIGYLHNTILRSDSQFLEWQIQVLEANNTYKKL